MEIHEMYFQVWHRLSITPTMLNVGVSLCSLPSVLCRPQAVVPWQQRRPQVHIYIIVGQ